jgi:hypothetical protein
MLENKKMLHEIQCGFYRLSLPAIFLGGLLLFLVLFFGLTGLTGIYADNSGYYFSMTVGSILAAIWIYSIVSLYRAKTEISTFEISRIEEYEHSDDGSLDYYIHNADNRYSICEEFMQFIKESDMINAEIKKNRITKIHYIIRKKDPLI